MRRSTPKQDRRVPLTESIQGGSRRSALRRQRRTDEFLVIATGDLGECRRIEELLVGGWELEGPGRLPTLTEEPLGAGGPEEQKETSFRRVDVEGMRDVARTVDDRATHRFDHGFTMLDSNLAGEDDEEFVLLPMDMERRGESLGRTQLQRGESSVRQLTGGLEDAESAVEPQGLALARSQCVAAHRLRQ